MSNKKIEDHIMQISKEITIKFIEIGRISPSTFPDIFNMICQSVNKTITNLNNPNEN